MKTYEVEIGFCGFIGCTNTYTVDADNEEEARELAIEMAVEDLTLEEVREQED